ncbi:MAG: DUF881 domain-containing protein [Geodermatophilaceae bacterium]|nr:DUF881 domain-containing protein [Geodermatophilaceae bacterium]MDQ3465502.1 DUF881 domain-containing protein [Actinomycetota bacterium]
MASVRGRDEPTAAVRRRREDRPGTGHGGWRLLVPLAALVAGVLFATSAETSGGTDLRAGRRIDLTQLIAVQERDVAAQTERLSQLQSDVSELGERVGAGNAEVAAAQIAADALAPDVGLTAVHGPGVTVALDDAPTTVDGTLPAGARANDVVVHQSDIQAVVNALWAGGAEAMTLMGDRIIATSAVRCVGNTLLLHGRTYSPPFRVTAIGDPQRMQEALDDSRYVGLFREAVAAFGLGYEVGDVDDVTVPAYEGPLGVDLAVDKDSLDKD